MKSAEANEQQFYVLSTDYNTFAVGWGCEDLADNKSRELQFIRSRTPKFPPTADFLYEIADLANAFLNKTFTHWNEQSEAM